jgi:hypothetical protein
MICLGLFFLPCLFWVAPVDVRAARPPPARFQFFPDNYGHWGVAEKRLVP